MTTDEEQMSFKKERSTTNAVFACKIRFLRATKECTKVQDNNKR